MRPENIQLFQTYQTHGPLAVDPLLDLRLNGLGNGMDALEEVLLTQTKNPIMLSMMLKTKSIWAQRMVSDIILGLAIMLEV